MYKGIHSLTRKAATGFLLSLILFALFSCFFGGNDKSSVKGKSVSEVPVFSDTVRLQQINVPGNYVYGAVLDDLDKSNLRNIDLALKIFLNNRADSLSRDSMLVSFNEFMTSVMQEYYDNKLLGNKQLTDNFLNRDDQGEAKKLTESLAHHGIQLFFREGEFYLEPDLGFVSQKLHAVLSIASREYLKTRIKLTVNQGISVPDSIANQIVAWEEFQSVYPGYVMKDDIQSQYLDAISAYLSGVEQLPLFDPETKKITPEYLSSYQHFRDNNPKRESAKIVKKFYELLTRKGFKYDEAMDTFLSEENLIPTQKTE